MLIECLSYALTPCPLHLRKMGYLSEMIATRARYRRHRLAWHEHLSNTKQAITEAINHTVQKRIALIFGAGHLYDIPLDLLSSKFNQVVLLDIVKPLRSYALSFRYPNVSYIAWDVTGCVEHLFNCQGKLPIVRHTYWECAAPVDLVVSLNIASQLPVIPKAWLLKKGVEEQEISQFSRELIKAHFENLTFYKAANRCVITDLAFVVLDKEGKELESEDALDGEHPPGKQTAEWQWPVAPAPEIDKKLHIVHRVGAFSG